MVEAVCKDFESASIEEKEKVLLRYVAKVNDEAHAISQEDVDRVLAAGWSEAAVFDAATVCALFNYFNRWIDATGVPGVDPQFYKQRMQQMGDLGYAM